MNVTVDRESILLLLCDYLEKNGLIATLTALETEADVRPISPALTAVRGLALGGKWRELEKALLHRHEEENQQHRLFKRAQYSLAKQLYLETVAALDEISPHREPSDGELDEVERCLGRLERLAPSREEYSYLRALSESPTDFFRDWNLQKARKETCGDLLAWCRADCFKGREENRENEEKTGEICQLTLLLVRGKMYEQCEEISARRCRNAGSGEQSKKKKTSAIQDLPSWLQTQPDSVFQETPRLVQVTEAGGDPGANTLPGGVGERHTLNAHPQAGEEPAIARAKSPHTVPSQTSTATPEVTKFPANSPPKLPTLSKTLGQHQTSPPELAKLSSLSSSPPLATPALQPKKFTSEPSSESTSATPTLPVKETKTKAKREGKTTRLEPKEEGVSASVEGEDREGREGIKSSKGRERGNCSGPRESKSKRERVTEHRGNVEVATEELRLSLREESTQRPSASCTSPEKAPSFSIPPPDQQTQGLTADNDLHPPAWALQTTPLNRPQQKKDRNSSTPKPSTQHFIVSPPTSPVPHQSSAGLQAMPSGWSHDRGAPSERKQIDFDREASQNCGAEELLPTASWPTATLIGRVTDSQAVRSVAFSESGQLVAVGANSKRLRILSTAPLLDNCSGEELTVLQELPRYHRGSIYCLAWSGDRLLASGSNDKSIKLLICQPGTDPSNSIVCEARGRMNIHQGTVRELVFLTETLLASGGSGEPSLVISDGETLQMVTNLSGHERQVLSVARGGQGSTIVSGGEDGTVRLWDWSSGKCIHTLPLSEPATSLSTHQQTVAVAAVDGSCAVYDARNWGLVTSYQPHSDECRSVRHSPCGRWLLTGSYDGSMCLGEAGGAEWVEVAQHEDKVVQARWHPGGEVFASTSSDKTACFWSLQC